MQENIFLFLAMVFAATSIGRGYVPEQNFEPSAPLAFVSATNGSSLEEIMQELGLRTTTRYIIGPYIMHANRVTCVVIS